MRHLEILHNNNNNALIYYINPSLIMLQLDLKYRERLTSSTRTVEEERERLRRRETDIEQGLYNQRQTLLIEMEGLKLRENELTRQSELDRRQDTVIFLKLA